MIRTVQVSNEEADSLLFDIWDSSLTGCMITSVTGLTPVNGTIYQSEISSGDGTFYNSSRTSSRNIVINFKLLTNNCRTIEENRHKLYKLFPVKGKVKLWINSDIRQGYTEGYVEKNEPNIFSEDERQQISIICPDPILYSSDEKGATELVFAGLDNIFEFILEPIDDSIEFSNMGEYTERSLYYDGEDKTGVVIKIHANGAASGLIVYDITNNSKIQLNSDTIRAITGSDISAGDDILINTIRGHKKITLTRNGTEYNLLGAMDKTSAWIELERGTNSFVYACTSGEENLEFKIEYRSAYQGM